MKPINPKASRVMVDAIVNQVIPPLKARGFLEMPQIKEAIPSWDFHRQRRNQGFDVFSITFDDKRRPYFYGAINIIDPKGIRQPWGEFIEADQATAFHPLKRILIQKKHSGFLAFFLPFWFSHGWFGFKANDNAEATKAAALRASEEFIACLDQAEKWWASRELGPNLVNGDIGPIAPKQTSGTSHASNS